MGLMFARRAADAKKQIAVNKAKAHAENHKKAHAAFAAEELRKKETKAASDATEKAPHDVVKSGTK
jgi:hypothetical protein